MNDTNEINDPDQQPLENLLHQVSLADPSPDLDDRIAALLRPKPRRWTGPAWGFAAGVLATACVMGAMPLASKPTTPAPPPPSRAPQSASPSSPALAVLVEPRRQVEQHTGTVNVVPVTLGRTDYQYLIWPTGGGGTPASVDLPQDATVRQVVQY
jgi:hypothetical protein